MGSDLARVSFDPTRQYRSVVAQQGRVTLEADVNEAARIATEALRLEIIDLVGPAATPDDGYKVGLDANGEFSVGPGTLYLGGWRLHLPASVPLDAQPDWLDIPPFASTEGPALIALLASEQSVCAVEDTALREVALGGPDSAARSRLMQHFLRLIATGRDCATAAGGLATQLQQDGVSIDPATDRLHCSARLQVGFTPPTTPPDPCQPAAQGGYLGADNQMVRVTVTAFDAAKREGTLAWGWNNASFLYRASVASPQTLSLSPVPLDAEHAPQQGQAVEILLTQADLGDGDLIAAPAGDIVVLTQAYDPDTNLLTLPSGYTLPTTKYPLFVRLWQAVVPFTPGTPVALDTVSGLTVSIAMTALPKIAGRPFWHFAVRPETPVLVYPRGYLDAPQPPDGPRQWLCDLAVVQGTSKRFQVLDDCRTQWPHGGVCCDTVLDPAGLAAAGGLQAVLDGLAATGQPATLSLRPGSYTLAAPLSLTAKHQFLTLEGCGDGAILQADATALSGFTKGLLLLQQAQGISLRRLVLEVPAAPPAVVSATIGEPAALMLGVSASGCTDLAIDSCRFVFTPSPKTTSDGAAIFVTGGCQGLSVRRSDFVCTSLTGTQAQALFGVYLSAAATTAALDDLDITDNRFAGLGIAISVNIAGGAGLGLLRCCANRMRQCDGGIFVVATPAAQSPSTNPPPTDVLAKLALQLQAGIAATEAAATGVDGLLATLEQDTEAAETAGQPLIPALHLRDNDITLSSASTFAGLSLALTGTQVAQAMITGNRVATPGLAAAAATLALSPGQAVVAGNLFAQGPAKAATAVPCLGVQLTGGALAVMANVVRGRSSITPARQTPLPATTAWEFLNTTG